MTPTATGDAGTSTLSRAKAELVLLALSLAQRAAGTRPERRKAVERLDRQLDHAASAGRLLESLVCWWCGM